MRKLVLVFFIILVLSIGVVYAANNANFDVDYSAIKDSVAVTEVATYNLVIYNLGSADDRYQVYTNDPAWIITTEPTIISVPTSDSKIFSLTIRAVSDTLPGPHLIPVRIKALSDSSFIEKNVFLYLKSNTTEVREYTPSISLDVNAPAQIDPRQKLSIEIVQRNRNALNIKEMKVKITSELFTKDFSTSLGPLEEKTNDVLVDLNPIQAPGKYSFEVELIRNNQTIEKATVNFEVLGYSDISVNKVSERKLFRVTETINLKNSGNYDKSQTVKEEAPLIKRLFTATTPKGALITENGKKYFSWDVLLKAQQTAQIKIATDYTWLVIVLIILVVLFVLYFIFRSPVIINKEAKIALATQQGISEIKVKLFVKNRTRKIVHNIKVIDTIPRIAELVEDSEILGTIQPTKVMKDRIGTVARWDIEKLEAYEERIVMYKIRSSLNIVGNVNLPSAKIKFESKIGQERSYSSNSMEVHNPHKMEKKSEQKKPEQNK